MTVIKNVNYTKANEARLREVYSPTSSEAERTAQVNTLAEQLGKSSRSVIAKLTNMELLMLF